MAGQLTDSMTAATQNPEDIPDQFMDAIVLDDEDEPTVPLKKRGRKPKTESTSKQKDEWTAADFESFRVQKPEELKPAPEKLIRTSRQVSRANLNPGNQSRSL